MKVRRFDLEQERNRFVPFGITITIETKDEFKELFNRFNFRIENKLTSNTYPVLTKNNFGKVFDILYEEAKRMGDIL